MLVRTLHTADLDVSMLSTRNDLHTFKVICQNNNITARSICLKRKVLHYVRYVICELVYLSFCCYCKGYCDIFYKNS